MKNPPRLIPATSIGKSWPCMHRALGAVGHEKIHPAFYRQYPLGKSLLCIAEIRLAFH
jgi:hypothetical protein